MFLSFLNVYFVCLYQKYTTLHKILQHKKTYIDKNNHKCIICRIKLGGIMTKLKEYLFRKEKKMTVFARELEMSSGYLTQIVKGNIIPSKRLAREISQATGGEVTVEDLLKKEKDNE